jgi:hypothetical protein
MPAEGQAEPHHRIARLRERKIDRLIRRRARVGLHIRVLHAEQRLRALDRERLDSIDVFLALVVAAPRIPLGVLVVQYRARRFHHGGGRVVLGRDQADELVLPLRLETNQLVDLGVGHSQRRMAVGLAGHPGFSSGRTAQAGRICRARSLQDRRRPGAPHSR